MVHSERVLTIREISDDDEFAAWLNELTRDHPMGPDLELEERHLALTDEIGDWIGGLRYVMRGGVAQIVDVGITPAERGRGHALRLLEAFEAAARAHGAHLIEFWTDRLGLEPLLAALGWQRVVSRPRYIGGRTWYLLEKPIPATAEPA